MAKLKQGKIIVTRVGREMINWDTDYLGDKKGKRTNKAPAKNVKKFKR